MLLLFGQITNIGFFLILVPLVGGLLRAFNYCRFVDRFGDRIHVVRLHDNDGKSDAHDPFQSFRDSAADIGATYNALEMKSRADVKRCVGMAAPD